MTLIQQLKNKDLFDHLNQEGEKSIDRYLHKEQNTLQALMNGFETSFSQELIRGDIYDNEKVEQFYKICFDNIPKQYTGKDLNNFLEFYAQKKIQIVQEMPHNLENKIGLYVSALINSSEEEKWNVNIPLIVPMTNSWYFAVMGFIGYKNNGKKIIIEGRGFPKEGIGKLMSSGEIIIEPSDAGTWNWGSVGDDLQGGTIRLNREGKYSVGSKMEGGRIFVNENVREVGMWGMKGGLITVNGNVESSVGCDLQGGEILIEGNVGNRVGYGMKGGKIYVKEEIKGTPGQKMSGGKIYIEGKYFRIPKSATGGNIYRNGKLVMKNGRKVK